MDIVKKSDVVEILRDIKINYNRGNYAIQNLRRLSFFQLLNWLNDTKNNSYNAVLVGHLTMNVSALNTLNDFLITNGLQAITPSAIVTQFLSSTPTILETEQINNYSSATTLNDFEQYQRYFSVFNQIRVGIDNTGSPRPLFYPDKSVTWSILYDWFSLVDTNLTGLGSGLDSLISFVGYEAIISI